MLCLADDDPAAAEAVGEFEETDEDVAAASVGLLPFAGAEPPPNRPIAVILKQKSLPPIGHA